MPAPAPAPWSTRDVYVIEGEVEVLEIDALRQERGGRFTAHTGLDPRAPATLYRSFRISPRRRRLVRRLGGRVASGPGTGGSTGRSKREPDVLLEAGRIEPGDTDGDREGGPAQQMETR